MIGYFLMLMLPHAEPVILDYYTSQDYCVAGLYEQTRRDFLQGKVSPAYTCVLESELVAFNKRFSHAVSAAQQR